MSKANPAVIGGFVIGGIALIVIGLLVFGGTSWFAKRNTYVAYFPGSVKGLQVGANVDFRGVTIGQITQVKVQYDPADQSFRIPVIMEFDPSRIDIIGGDRSVQEDENLDELIKAGLRAQLQSASLLTGLLFVNLDFKPDTPVNLTGGKEPYPEVPTIESGMEKIQESAGNIAQQLPVLIDDLTKLLKQIDDDLSDTSSDFKSIVANIDEITGRLRDRGPDVQKIVENTAAATADVRQAAQTLDQILQTNSDAVGTLIDEWTLTAGSVRRLSDQVNDTLAENQEGLNDFIQTGLYEYTGLAQDAQRMVDQITRVVEQLERDPSGFLFGDRAQQGVRPQ